MGSTSFLGFSYPNLLLVFLNLLFFRNLYHIFLAASVRTLSGSFFILSLFLCTIFWVSLKGQVYKSSTSTCDIQTILFQDFVPIRTALREGGIASSSLIFFFCLLYLVLFLYSIFCLCPSFRVWSDGLPFGGFSTLTCFLFF